MNSALIFYGQEYIIPFLNVSHIIKYWRPTITDRTDDNYSSIVVITEASSRKIDGTFENTIRLTMDEARAFLKAWEEYIENKEAKDKN